MISARELRIGNLFQDKKGNFHEIELIHLEHIQQWPESDLIKPIPLTGEWLVKLGFKKSIKLTTYFKRTGKNSINNRYSKSIEVWQPDKKQFALSGQKSVPLPYVHQLQNLYFALTGQELKLNQIQ